MRKGSFRVNLVHILLVIVVLALLIAIHEFGHFICAKSLGVPVKIFSIGFPLGNKPLFGFRWGETDVQLNPLPLGGFCAFMDDENSAEGEAEFAPGDKRFLKNRAIWERAIIITGGVVANIIVAYIILVGLVFGTGIPDGEANGVMVGQVMEKSPAAAAGFAMGDKILSINGQTVKKPEDMQEKVKSLVGQKIEVKVERQNKELTLTPQPAANGTIGVQIGTLAKRRPAANGIEPFTQGAKDLVSMSTMLVGALGKLVSGALPLNQVGGLVEVVHMGSKVSQTGFTQLLYFAALISIELAILNILPIPALDGGHLFLLLIEGLRGRPLPRRIEENMHYAGFIVLIGLGVLLIFKDVWSIARGGG